jgi:KipI family sensor histidine kinase inhibitor
VNAAKFEIRSRSSRYQRVAMRFLPVNLNSLIVELEDLDETLALYSSLEASPIEGLEEAVPAARTILIRYRRDVLGAAELAGNLRARTLGPSSDAPDGAIEIPVRYDGDDLQEVAEIIGISPNEVVGRHTASEYKVAFTGFAPGFAYLVGGDPSLNVPRRRSPRTRIPAGAVGLAGQFSGVYPQASPGGWQIIGTTNVPMWDISRTPPALLQPGMRVRFIDSDVSISMPTISTGQPMADAGDFLEESTPVAGIKVKSANFPALFQDLGRPGQAKQGVSVSGALDKGAMRAANRAVGNPSNTACLEIILGGFCFTAIGRIVIAICGAPVPIVVRDAVGRRFEAQCGQPVALEPGDIIEVGQALSGMRAYLAARGGFAVKSTLSSASTDTLAKIGPDPVVAGATIAVGGAVGNIASVSLTEDDQPVLPSAGDTVTLDVVMGPRTDWFTPSGISSLLQQSWDVTPQSNRVGMRLAGQNAIERVDAAELPSEGTAMGAIQVPHSGQPVLFLADHPLTGGYPVIATVAEHHLNLAGQIPIGARIRFRAIRQFAEIAPTATA